MHDAFKIYVDRLRDGQREKLHFQLAPSFIEVTEKDLAFNEIVDVTGEAFIEDKTLILHLTIGTQATMPCAICNEMIAVPIRINNFYHQEDIQSIRGGVFDMRRLLRETILLEVPIRAECNQGHCPERATLVNYLGKKE